MSAIIQLNPNGRKNPMEETALVTRPESHLVEKELGADARNPRCNIPFNLDNWHGLEPAVIDELTWFHQHILDHGLTNAEAAAALGYDFTVIYRALKGTYEGSWDNIAKAIDKYRRDWRERSKIQNVEFSPNRNTKLIWDALDYCVASNRITTIIGESGMSKSITVDRWRDANNSGRTILVEAPVLCTPITLGQRLCKAIGRKAAGRRAADMFELIEKALTRGRTLIIDEAHRLLPRGKADPICLELLRELHDHTKCGLALVATMRFDIGLRAGEYQFEQVLGRIGLPCRLFRRLTERDVTPLVEQYFARASAKVMAIALKIANGESFTHTIESTGSTQSTKSTYTIKFDLPGRLRALVELFRHASKVTHKERTDAKGRTSKMTEDDLKTALTVRAYQMGEQLYADH